MSVFAQHRILPFLVRMQSDHSLAARTPSLAEREMPKMKNPSEKKRKRRGDEAAADGASPSTSGAFDRDVYLILLAAAARTTRQNQHDSTSSAAAAAARLLRRVLSRSPPPTLSPLPGSLVALLPLLLSSSFYSVAALSCEVLGAAALQSMEASEMLASDGGIVNGLARVLWNGNHRVVEVACNSIMDLSASSVGREHLASSPVLARILWKWNLFLGLSIAGAPSAQQEFRKQIKFCA